MFSFKNLDLLPRKRQNFFSRKGSDVDAKLQNVYAASTLLALTILNQFNDRADSINQLPSRCPKSKVKHT